MLSLKRQQLTFKNSVARLRDAGFSDNILTFAVTFVLVCVLCEFKQLKFKHHQESGTPTANLPHPGKVVTAKAGCGLTGNQAGISPLDEGFFHGLVNHN